jgi:hypothetical protein
MRERFHGLRVVDIVADPDGSGPEVGVAVGSAAVTALDGEVPGGGLRGGGVPQSIGRLPVQERGPRRLADRIPGGLRNVFSRVSAILV